MSKDKKLAYPKTRELDKVKAVHEQSQALGNFISWLSEEKKLTICELVEGQTYIAGQRYKTDDAYVPVHLRIEQLLAEFFDIDLNKVEKERTKVLEYVRASQEL